MRGATSSPAPSRRVRSTATPAGSRMKLASSITEPVTTIQPPGASLREIPSGWAAALTSTPMSMATPSTSMIPMDCWPIRRSTRLAPIGQGLGAGAAWLVGKATSDESLANAGYQGLVEHKADIANTAVMFATVGRGGAKSGVPGKDFTPSENVTSPYVRPIGTTVEQRASVQGQPCVDCGAITPKQVADHIDPLVVQHYREGAVNIEQQSSVSAVQPHCPSCSASQGGQLGAFGRRMLEFFGL